MSEPLDEEDFNTLVRLAKKVLWSDTETRKKLESHKLSITPSNFYASIPSTEDIETSFEYRGEYRDGCYDSDAVFDLDRTAWFLGEIGTYAGEFDPPVESTGTPGEFFWDNTSFTYLDAMAYYCVVRYLKPERIVEVGSGSSTVVADMALHQNGSGELVLIEPYPADYLENLATVKEIKVSRIQDIKLQELVELLESAQLFFIDSTHTVKVGSDCLYIYLKLLPAVKQKLLVHAHDIALPYPLPRSKTDNHIYWTEQYLLYAYLLDNPKARVMMGSYYAQKQLPFLSKLMMKDRYDDGGGSLWFELNPELLPD